MAAFQESFEGKVHDFLVSNVKSFNNLTKEEPLPLKLCPKSTDLYGDPLPLELLMQVPVSERRKNILKLISPGDVVRGHVVMKAAVALGIQVTSFVGTWKAQAMRDLDMRGLIPIECLALDRAKCEVILEDMEVDDVVQAVVIGSRDMQLTLSFKMGDVSSFLPSWSPPDGVVLGFLEDERPQLVEDFSDCSSFLLDLKNSPGFANPSSTENLKEALGIRGYSSKTKPTLILEMQNMIYLESDFSTALRKEQRFKWSMETVAIGVKHFKEGNLEKALTVLHHALDIDPRNVEGLVARGALYANRSKFRKAIADFEAALTENCSHRNARKYLVETRMVYAEELEEMGHLEEAAECYRETLADDASQASAKEKLDKIIELLKRKADENLERERKEAAERARIKKLHSIIEEERKKKERKEVFTVQLKSDKKKRKKRKKKKYKKKSKQRHYSSDEESLFSSDTESSRSRSPVNKQLKKTHHKPGAYSRESRSGHHRRHHFHARHRSRSSYSPLIKGERRESVDFHSPGSLVSPRRKGRKKVREDTKTRLSSSEQSGQSYESSTSWSLKRKRRTECRGRNGSTHSDYPPSLSPQQKRSRSRRRSRRRSRSRSRRRSRSRSRRRSKRPSSDTQGHSSGSTHDRTSLPPFNRSSKERYKKSKAERSKVYSKSRTSHHFDYHCHNS